MDALDEGRGRENEPPNGVRQVAAYVILPTASSHRKRMVKNSYYGKVTYIRGEV